MDTIVTTTQSGAGANHLLEEFLEDSKFRFVPRERKSLDRICNENNTEQIIVWENDGPVLYIDNDKFFFHPSMAKNRLAAHRKTGRSDLLIQACELQKGDDFLDCTLGLGADSIVASYFSEYGKVVGLESSPSVAYTVRWGMKLYQGKMPWLNNAIKRIEVLNAEHLDYLRKQDDNSFDVVYFDPMFQKPLLKSKAISPLRRLANHDPLSMDVINEARRVARKKVVMKELINDDEFDRLGFKKIIGGKNNLIAYGVIEKL